MVVGSRFYNCGKCDGGLVQIEISETKHTIDCAVKPCAFCNYKYGIKESSELKFHSVTQVA